MAPHREPARSPHDENRIAHNAGEPEFGETIVERQRIHDRTHPRRSNPSRSADRGPDPLHLSLVFGISHNTALRYTTVAERLLSDELEQPVEP